MGNNRPSHAIARVFVALALTIPVTAVAQTPAARQTGTVKSIDGTTITVLTTAGAAMPVAVAPDALIEQLAPGVTDLKTAVPVKLSDIAVGDRVVTGKAGDTDTASRVIVIKSGDIKAKQDAEKADWQKRGTGGIIKAVDGPVLTVTAGTRTVKVNTSSTTVFRRYAPDSVNFQDAKAGTLADIHPGDQLSVRGDKSADGLTVTAEEVVSGSFANLSGLLTAVDPAAGTVSFKDLTTKKSVTVKLTGNSDVRTLPPTMAAMFAAPKTPAGGGTPPAPAAGGPGGAAAGGGRARGGADLSRMLPRLPTATIAQLKPKDAVMIVATPGADGDTFTAVTLLSGVEVLLTAPAGQQPVTLSPWAMGAPGEP